MKIAALITRGSGKSLQRLVLIKALSECNILVVEDEWQLDVIKLQQEIKLITKPIDDYNFKRQRDYPTLREGIRRKQIKSFRR